MTIHPDRLPTTLAALVGLSLAVLPAPGLASAGAKPPPGWFASGSHAHEYEMGTDKTRVYQGKPSAYIKSKVDKTSGFGTLMQKVDVAPYRGKRLRFSGYVKTEDVEQWAGLWMRVDGKKDEVLAFDNMQGRPLEGTMDWKEVSVVLDVDQKAQAVAFGILLAGKGQAFLNSVKLTPVDKDVPTTATGPEKEPKNLDFDEEK